MRFGKTIISSALVACLSLPALASGNSSTYKDIVGKLVPPNTPYTVKVEKKSELKGFKQLNVSIKNKNTGTIYHRYLWVSKNKQIIVPIVLKFENGRLTRVEPKVSVEQAKTDISWLNELLKEMPKNAKKSIGKGVEVYMFSDPYCPFCKRELPRLLKLAKEGKIKLHIIPFDVHGERAARASALFLNIEKNKGLNEAINKVEGAEFSKVSEAVKNQKNMGKIYKEYKPLLDKILRTAFEHGINGTPAMIIKTGKNEGYVILGLQDISKYIKKK